MKAIVLLYITLLFPSNNCCARSGNTPVEQIQSFIKALQDGTDTDKIIENYLCYSTSGLDSLEAQQAHELLVSTIESIKPEFKSTKIQSLKIIPYLDLPEKEQNIMIKKDTKGKVYVVKHGDKRMMNVLIGDDGKIISCITMMKGEVGFFISFC